MQNESAVSLLTQAAAKVTDIPATGDTLLISVARALHNAGATLTPERLERWGGGTITDLCVHMIRRPCMPSNFQVVRDDHRVLLPDS